MISAGQVPRQEPMGDLSERGKNPSLDLKSVQPRFLKPAPNNLVKVRLTKLQPRSDLPYSAQVYDTEETDTEFNPHPRELLAYTFSVQESVAKINSSTVLKNPTAADLDLNLKQPILKNLHLSRVLQEGPTNTLSLSTNQLHMRDLIRTDDKVTYNRSRSDRSNQSPEKLKVDCDGGAEDSRITITPMMGSAQKHPLSASMVDTGGEHSRKQSRNLKHMSSIDNRTNDTNFGNTSKHQSEMGGFHRSRSILKTSKDRTTKSRDYSKKVQFSKLRTVVYFKLLKEEIHHKQMLEAGMPRKDSDGDS